MRTYIDEQTGTKMCCADCGADIEWIVTAVTPEDDYTLLVDFADGKRKRFDMKPLIERGGVFARLKDLEYFRKAHVARSTVAWDEMVDIAPESLYERGVTVV